MAKKRTTLVNNFDEIIKSRNMAEFKAVFDKCEINATGGYAKGTALHYYDLSDEMGHWLVENGADINALDTYNNTPLHRAASRRGGKIEIFIELGAKINAKNSSGNTPLHKAAGNGFNPENVKSLIDNGADPLIKNSNKQTPLEYGLTQVENIDIVEMATIAEILLKFQTNITEKMKQAVTKIGKNFEFYRNDYNKESLPEAEAGLESLYELFNVEPVVKRKIFDGVSQIKIKPGTWQQQFDEIWELLIPGQGAASTIQGEVIRICGKVSREILDNGAPNWNKEYKKLPQALPGYFSMGNPLEQSLYNEAEKLAKSISANSDDISLDRLSELAVKWVIANPTPIPLGKVDYNR